MKQQPQLQVHQMSVESSPLRNYSLGRSCIRSSWQNVRRSLAVSRLLLVNQEEISGWIPVCFGCWDIQTKPYSWILITVTFCSMYSISFRGPAFFFMSLSFFHMLIFVDFYLFLQYINYQVFFFNLKQSLNCHIEQIQVSRCRPH